MEQVQDFQRERHCAKSFSLSISSVNVAKSIVSCRKTFYIIGVLKIWARDERCLKPRKNSCKISVKLFNFSKFVGFYTA